MAELKAIILAAGKGVRMKSNLPKVLHRIGQRPIVRYVFDAVKGVKPKDIIMVVGHKGKLVSDYFEGKVVSVTQKKLLGTADAIKMTASRLKNFNGNVLVVCGDAPLLKKETLKKLIKKHDQKRAVCTVLTTIVDDATGYGRIIRNPKGSVIAIREEKDASIEEKRIQEINTGVYCFRNKALFSYLKKIRMNVRKKEFYLTDIIDLFIKDGLVVETAKTLDSTEGLGINSRSDLALAHRILNRRNVNRLINQGVTIVDPETTFIDEDVTIGRDTTVRPFTVIEEDVRVGKECLIGPFCRLRSHTRIGNNVSVGNYTEVARATIGKDCFMQHFSYVGDATVGDRVNIGAGVVTANFDGKNKNQTRIENDVFIGSDSILIAPLTVGRGSVTGAGCVIPARRSVPQNSIAVGVPARIISRRKRT